MEGLRLTRLKGPTYKPSMARSQHPFRDSFRHPSRALLKANEASLENGKSRLLLGAPHRFFAIAIQPVNQNTHMVNIVKDTRGNFMRSRLAVLWRIFPRSAAQMTSKKGVEGASWTGLSTGSFCKDGGFCQQEKGRQRHTFPNNREIYSSSLIKV